MISTYELHKSGLLDDLIKKGLISTKISTYCKMYGEYLHRRDLGSSYYDAVGFLADKYCMSERTVQRALKRAAT